MSARWVKVIGVAMNYIEKHFAEFIASDPLRASFYEGEIDEFDSATDFSRVISYVNANPHKFMELIKMAEIILSVRDVLWREGEGNC
jgi:hypothetical protein